MFLYDGLTRATFYAVIDVLDSLKLDVERSLENASGDVYEVFGNGAGACLAQLVDEHVNQAIRLRWTALGVTRLTRLPASGKASFIKSRLEVFLRVVYVSLA